MHSKIRKFWEDQGWQIMCIYNMHHDVVRSWSISSRDLDDIASNYMPQLIAEELVDGNVLYYGLPVEGYYFGVSEIEAIKIIKLKAFI